MTKVAIQNGLQEIADKLMAKGIEVVSLEESQEPVDAMVYSGVNCDWEGCTGVQNLEASLEGENNNILMINTVGMSADEAVDLIESRVSE